MSSRPAEANASAARSCFCKRAAADAQRFWLALEEPLSVAVAMAAARVARSPRGSARTTMSDASASDADHKCHARMTKATMVAPDALQRENTSDGELSDGQSSPVSDGAAAAPWLAVSSTSCLPDAVGTAGPACANRAAVAAAAGVVAGCAVCAAVCEPRDVIGCDTTARELAANGEAAVPAAAPPVAVVAVLAGPAAPARAAPVAAGEAALDVLAAAGEAARDGMPTAQSLEASSTPAAPTRPVEAGARAKVVRAAPWEALSSSAAEVATAKPAARSAATTCSREAASSA